MLEFHRIHFFAGPGIFFSSPTGIPESGPGRSGAVPKKLQVVIVTVVIVHVVELQAVTSYNVTRTKNVLVTLQHVQLQVTTGKTGKNSSKT